MKSLAVVLGVISIMSLSYAYSNESKIHEYEQQNFRSNVALEHSLNDCRLNPLAAWCGKVSTAKQ